MKKMTYLLAAAMLLFLPSCRFIHVTDEFKEKMNADVTWNGSASAERIKASDNYITRNETTGEFHSLTSNLPGKIIYTPGDCSVSIYGPDNVLDHITVRNENGLLEIKSNLYRISNLKGLTVKISSPVLEKLTFNGAVDFKAPEGITALNFSATLNGAGDVNIAGRQANEAVITVNGAADANLKGIDCDELKIAINGAGDATLSGKAGRASLSISGAGDINAQKLECADLNTTVRGLGSIKKPKS